MNVRVGISVGGLQYQVLETQALEKNIYPGKIYICALAPIRSTVLSFDKFHQIA